MSAPGAGRVALVGLIRGYQAVIRPIAGCNCRFHPSCSDYGIDAVRQHGVLKGGALAAARILRCNPWTPGGYDPVPEPDLGRMTR